MPQSPWPPVAYHGLYTKTPPPPPLAGCALKESRKRTPHPLPPTRKLLESRVTLNNIFNTLRWMPSA